MIRAWDNLYSIGDALNAVPFYLSVASEHRSFIAVQGGFCPAVRPLLSGLPICFDTPSDRVDYTVNVEEALQYSFTRGSGLHVAQIYFALAGKRPPPLPICIPLVESECDLRPSVMIAPFSKSINSRVWANDRWNEVIDFIVKRTQWKQIYLVCGPHDDLTDYSRVEVTPLVNRPLPDVLFMIRRAPLFLSIDSGPSHLAHYGAQRNHILLYSDELRPLWACNPYGRIIRGKMDHIYPGQVIDQVREMLLAGTPGLPGLRHPNGPGEE